MYSLNIFRRCESKTFGSSCFIMDLYFLLCSVNLKFRTQFPYGFPSDFSDVRIDLSLIVNAVCIC